MINLLPPDLKQSYTYARHNSVLLKMVTAFGLGIVILAIIAATGVVYLQQTAQTYRAQAAADQARLAAQNQAQTEKQINDITTSLRLAVQVLSREVLFSQLLNQLALVTPSRARLSNVDITKYGGGVDISAETADYNAATQLQVNLTDPNNKIFSKADIVSITCSSDPTTLQTGYPCKATYRALFAKDNPFLFVNSGKVGG